MTLLPDSDRILLGPGPSLTSPRVMRAMACADGQPSRSASCWRCSTTCGEADDCSAPPTDRLRSRCPAPARPAWKRRRESRGREGTRALVVVTGYFGDRLAQMCERYGATVTRLDVEWGRAAIPTRCGGS